MSLSSAIEIVTGLATMALAAVTSWMAYETRKLSQSAKKSVDQSENEITQLKAQTVAISDQSIVAHASLLRSSLPILVPIVPNDVALISEKASLRSSLATGGAGINITIRDTTGITRSWPTTWRGSRILRESRVDGSVWIVIEMRNIGTGPALVAPRYLRRTTTH